jgi:nucleoside-diphosphate-sugar epimerase
MRLLLTGAEGFTGFHFANAAKKHGFEVFSLKSDVTDYAGIISEIADIAPSYVVHFAGISSTTHSNEEDLYRVNLMGTMNLLKALCALPKRPQKVILASTASVYGNSTSIPISEHEPPFPLGHYAASKLAMESMSNVFKAELPIVCARPFNYTGVGQKGNFLIPKLVDHFAKRKPFIELGNLNIEREFNDVNMICAAYLELLNLGKANEIYNVCSGQARSLQFVMDTLKQITGHDIEIRVNPDFVRASEVHRMVGNPEKLKHLLASNGLSLQVPALEDTFKQMLNASSASSSPSA